MNIGVPTPPITPGGRPIGSPPLDPRMGTAEMPPGPPPLPPTTWGDPTRGGGRSALTPAKLILAFAAIFLLLVVVGALAVALLAPPPKPPDCPDPNQVCGGPPVVLPPIGGFTPAPAAADPSSPPLAPSPGASFAVPSLGAAPSFAIIVPPQPSNPDSPPLRTGQLFSSTQWAYGVEHEEYWNVEEQPGGAVSLVVSFRDVPAQVVVRFDAANAAEVSPSQLLQTLEQTYQGRIQSLAEDTADQNRILRPTIGHLAADGRVYRGTLGTEGGIQPVSLVLIAATDGRLTVAVTVLATIPDSTFPDGTRVFRIAGYLVDPILKRFDWQATP